MYQRVKYDSSVLLLLQTYSDEEIRVDVSKLTLSGNVNDPSRGSIDADIDPTYNFLTSTAYSRSVANDAAPVIQACLASISQANHNLSEPQKELLCWHYPLGHVGFCRVQFLL
jgi:hypothetical protein